MVEAGTLPLQLNPGPQAGHVLAELYHASCVLLTTHFIAVPPVIFTAIIEGAPLPIPTPSTLELVAPIVVGPVIVLVPIEVLPLKNSTLYIFYVRKYKT